MKTKKEKKTAVGYVRTAVVAQDKKPNSIGVQEQRIKEHCQKKGYELTDVVSDSGKSGANLERSGLNNLLSYVKRGEVKAIICTHPDRISRTAADYFVFEALVKKYGVELIFTDLPPYPKFLGEMVTSRSIVGYRIRRGMRKKGK